MTVIYVCTDTRWQSINLVPALAAGTIDYFLFLSARRGGDFENSDAAHATRPRAHLLAAYEHERTRHRLSPNPQRGFLAGPLVGVQPWREALLRELGDAPHGAEIIVNYLSGPSDVKVAAWLALQELAQQRPDLRLRCVLYDPPADGEPARLEWNEWQAPGWRQHSAAVEHLISLEAWLHLHGYQHDPNLTAARERFARDLAPEVGRLRTLTYDHPRLPSGWFVEISGSIKRGTVNNLAALGAKYLPHIEEAERAQGLAELRTLAKSVAEKIDPKAYIAPARFSGSHDFIEFFRATWFELAVYLELRDRLSDGAAQVIFDLKIGRSGGKEPGGGAVHQLDVTVLANNQLHYVECKSYRLASSPKRAAQSREHLNHLHRVKETLIGPGGIALLTSAAPNDAASATARYAELGQMEFAAGWSTICAALGRIASRCAQPADVR